jgi:thioredoxin reductase (NADPH)
MYDIIIIGAGPAGLSAAIYALRAGKSVLVLEGKTYGGQIVNTQAIENYPGIKRISGFEFATGLYEQAKDLGAQIKMEKVLSIQKTTEKEHKDSRQCWVVTTAKAGYLSDSLILSIGAKNRLLGLDGEEKLTGAGISYCATCDGMFYKNQIVAVNGGGNTALEDALFLSNYCKKVYLIHRRESFRGEKKLVETLRNKENVTLLLDTVVTQLLGEEKLTGICIRDCEGVQKELALDGLFIAIGQEPNTDIVKDLVMVDEKGYICAGEDCKTTVPGIFAAGDCRTKAVRQLTTAAADGAVAALASVAYLEE